MRVIKIPTPDDHQSEAQAVTETWFPVALTLRPQGRRGELLCETLTDLDQLFAKGAILRGVPASNSGSARTFTLEDAWAPQGRNAGRIVLKLEGVNSISEAEILKGVTLSVQESMLPAMEEDAFLVRDLLGCALFDGSQRLGVVTEVQFAVGPDGRTRLVDAPDLLVVQLDAFPDDKPVMIPFVKLWLQSVNLPTKELHMHLPPDLVDDLRTLHFPDADDDAANVF